ncbi:MAG TPA: response regulator [Candidatus Limnocylindria bacterium]|nr:response regulator [Candidatus Limnocylindria bacterium]
MESATSIFRRTAGATAGLSGTLGAPAQRRPALLVVDDDEPLREALRLIFEYQYDIILADSGSQALSLIQRGNIDVAIIDLRMPGMSGLEFLERSRTLDPDIQAVILSGQNTFEMARQAVRLKAFDFLPKPFDLHLLRQTILLAARHRAWLRLERQREAAVQQSLARAETAGHERHLLASLLNELVQPLSAVLQGARSLEQEVAKASAPTADQLRNWRRQLQEITSQATLCADLSARPRPDLNASCGSDGVPASQLMDNLVRLLRSHPSTKGQMLTIRPPAVPVGLFAHEGALLRILVNLGLNALEGTGSPHRVDIESWLVNEPLSLGATERGQGHFVLRDTFRNEAPLLAISVKDDGPGIAPALWPALFQSAVSTKTASAETGLGLSVVRELVAANACALELRTTPGLGTTVTLYVTARRLTTAL